METTLEFKIDLERLSFEDVKNLKNILVKLQDYEGACLLRDYERHLLNLQEYAENI